MNAPTPTGVTADRPQTSPADSMAYHGSPSLPPRTTAVTWFALLVALAGVAGSLYFTLGLRLYACPFCFYQRTFVMAVAGVLLLGLLSGAGRQTSLGLLALPLAVGGLGVAGFHFYKEASGALECPAGLFDRGTAPQQSLAMFTMLVVLLLADVMQGPGSGLGKLGCLMVALLIGGGSAFGCIVSSAQPPKPPVTKPYDDKPKICRPPYKEQAKKH